MFVRLPEAFSLGGSITDKKLEPLGKHGRWSLHASGDDPTDSALIERVLDERPYHPAAVDYLVLIHWSGTHSGDPTKNPGGSPLDHRSRVTGEWYSFGRLLASS